MIKKSLLLLIVVFGALSLSVLAQKSELAVENVDFLVEGDRIVVVYDITNSKEAEVYDIDLKFVTESNNVIIPKTVSGDIGRRVKGGRYKKITWDVLTDKGDVNEKMKAVITITSVVNSLFENVGGGPSNMFLSMLMPGLGDYYVKKDKTRKRPYWLIPVTVYSLYTWSSVSNSIYKSKYQEYHDATDQETMDAEWETANSMHKQSIRTFRMASVIWVADIAWVFIKGIRNNRIKNKYDIAFNGRFNHSYYLGYDPVNDGVRFIYVLRF